MLRTRILSFALGFCVTGAAISHFVWRDLYTDRFSISAHMKEQFEVLENRISELESLVSRDSRSIKDES